MGKIVIMMGIFCITTSFVCRANETPSASWQGNNVSANQKTESLYEQGIDASKNNDYQKALPLFTQALNADPNNPNILKEKKLQSKPTNEEKIRNTEIRKTIESTDKCLYCGETIFKIMDLTDSRLKIMCLGRKTEFCGRLYSFK